MKNTSTAALKKLLTPIEIEKTFKVNKELAKAITKTGQRTYIRHFWKNQGSQGVAQTEVVRNIDFTELKKVLGLKKSVITKVYVDEKKKSRIDLFFVEIGQGDFIDLREQEKIKESEDCEFRRIIRKFKDSEGKKVTVTFHKFKDVVFKGEIKVKDFKGLKKAIEKNFGVFRSSYNFKNDAELMIWLKK